jgi:hypothetical protein
MLRFVMAVNRSKLHTLSLTNNTTLSESLCNTFLPMLSAPRLTELQLSLCSLDPSSVPTLTSYLTSPRAIDLKTLKLNGNPFGIEALKKIVDALEEGNWSLDCLEIYACCPNDPNSGDAYKTLETRFRTLILERNKYLAARTVNHAFTLLRHGRPVLLNYGRKTQGANPRLPMELVMKILYFLAPSLSTSQYLRVCKYAASPDTLPSIGLTIPPAGPFSAQMEASSWPPSTLGLQHHTRIAGAPGLISSSFPYAQTVMF